MRFKNIIVFFLFFVITNVYGQRKSIDSLLLKCQSTRNDTQKVNILNTLFVYFSTTNTDSAEKLVQKAYEISDRVNYLVGKINSVSNLGTVYYYQGKYAKALKAYLKSIQLVEILEKTKSSSLYSKRQLSSANNNIGLICQRQQQYYKAEEYFRKSLEIDKITGDKKSLAHCYNNIGTIKENLNEYDKALENYQLSLKYKIEINDSASIPSTLINIGILQMNQSKFDESTANFIKALNYSKKFNNQQDLALALINLGDLYYLKKEYRTSVTYYQKGIEICKTQKYKQFISYAYESISLSYYRIKDFENAYEYYRLRVSEKDSLYNIDNAKMIQEMATKYETESKEKEIKLLTKDKELQNVELKNSKLISYSALIGILFFAVFGFYVFYAYRQKQKINLELDIKNKKIEFAYTIIEEHQKEVFDSINYAKRIQYALLANDDLLKQNLKNYFILFNPKDIVSGDFYWATEHNNNFYLAVCDSTGHGVPGAFMSLLNIGFLNEAIKEKNISNPNEILNYVRKRLIDSIGNDGQQDGMDAILICFDKSSQIISYSAANNEPVLIRNNKIIDLPKDKMPVGKGEKIESFTQHIIEVKKGDALYLYTDGYADQFGGPKGKKFKYRQLNELLLSLAELPPLTQKEVLENTLASWKGDLEQVDDICIVGLKI